MSAAVFLAAVTAALLALVALAVPAARRAGVPLPVAVAVVGLAAGLVPVMAGVDATALFLDAYEIWVLDALALDSRALLILFLPPLLFEMALAVNVRRLLDDAAVVLVMAVLAVILATASVGLAVWSVSPYGLVACLLLGAAISTTDPAAVISTFREIGTPRRLLVILEGESLLNDAAAIALFTVLLTLAGAAVGSLTLEGILGQFLYDFAVGAASGTVVAWLVSRLYPLLGGAATAEVSMTVALAYGSYLIAESALGASGVVAAVFAGLTTTVVGIVRMGPGNWSSVCTVWSQIGFWANTLILAIAAGLAPGLLLTLTWWEALLVPVAFAGALAARAAVLFGLLPGLSLIGLAAPITTAQKAVIWWGGVRGAVTLLLAFRLAEIGALPAGERTSVAAIAAGFVFLTLLLNASTLGLATRRLGLNALSAGDLALREKIIAETVDSVRQHVGDLAAERAIDPDAAREMQRAYEPQIRSTRAHADAAEIPEAERLRLGLAILCNQEHRLYRAAFDDGSIGAAETRNLCAIAERLADAARSGGLPGYVRAVDRALALPRTLMASVRLQRLARIDRPLRRQLALRLSILLESENVLRALHSFACDTLPGMVGADAAHRLDEVLTRRRRRLREQIDAIGAQYPVYTERVETILLLRAAARRERTQYDRLFEEGIIGAELHDTLVTDLESRRRSLRRDLPDLDLGLSARELVDQIPLFDALTPAQRRRLVRKLKGRLALPGEVILRAGERGSAMYVIASGLVEVRPQASGATDGDGPAEAEAEGPIWLTAGQFFGELAMLGLAPRRTADVVAVGFCRLLVLRRRDVERITRADPAVGRTIRAAAEARIAGRAPAPEGTAEAAAE
jgi:CPA1 family monovalent cation:H+ antiporter